MLTWWLPGCITAYFVELNEKHKVSECQGDRLSVFNPMETVNVRFSKSLSSIIIVLSHSPPVAFTPCVDQSYCV